MRVLAINGSARGAKGVTAQLLEALGQGLAQAGAGLKTMELARLEIAPCKACLRCMLATPGQCAQDDGMAQVYPALREADLLVLATPVYVDNMSAQLKCLLDRCICAMSPLLERAPDGQVRHPLVWPLPARWLLLATSGFPEPQTFAPLIATFRAQARNFHAQPLAELCLPGSLALQMQPALLEPHLGLLRRAGQALGQGGGLDPALAAAIVRPPLSLDDYLEACQAYQAACRRRLGI